MKFWLWNSTIRDFCPTFRSVWQLVVILCPWTHHQQEGAQPSTQDWEENASVSSPCLLANVFRWVFFFFFWPLKVPKDGLFWEARCLNCHKICNLMEIKTHLIHFRPLDSHQAPNGAVSADIEVFGRWHKLKMLSCCLELVEGQDLERGRMREQGQGPGAGGRQGLNQAGRQKNHGKNNLAQNDCEAVTWILGLRRNGECRCDDQASGCRWG